MRSIPRVAIASVLLGVASLACQGRVLPLSAQAGSTILVPVGGDLQFVGDVVGYGGTIQEDYQRGTLIYRLDGPSGMELVTRATSAVIAYPGADLTRFPTLPQRQIVSIVAIPANAPNGTHALHVTRRRLENGVPVEYPTSGYPGEIRILPDQLTVPLAGGGTETISGAETPFEYIVCDPTCRGVDITATVAQAIPRPEVRITFNQGVQAIELTVTYPPGVIDVVDVFEPPSSRSNGLAMVWRSDNPTTGVLKVGAVRGTAAFTSLSIAFALDNGAAQILDPAAVSVAIDKAFDLNGNLVSRSVTSKAIY